MKGHLVESRGKRGGSVWYLIYDEPRERGAPRKQHRERLGSMPKNHALARMRKILNGIDEGTWVKERRDLTVERFVTDWLDAVKFDLATNTHVRYAGLMKQHVIPRIGKMQLARVTPQHLSRIYKAVHEAGLSAQTALHIHRAVHTALNYAVKVTKDLRENVASRLKAPTVEHRVNTSITPEKVRALFASVRGTRLEAPIILAGLTGLRRGELLALTWATIDLKRESLYVAQAVAHTRRHGVEFKLPKSKRSRRVIPLAPECVELLRVHKERQAAIQADAGEAYDNQDLVFPSPDGSPWLPDSFSVQFAKLARTAGLEGFRLHYLRHSFATLALADGVSIRELSDLLGHGDPSFTVRTYAHAVPGAGRAAVTNLARSLLGPEVGTSA